MRKLGSVRRWATVIVTASLVGGLLASCRLPGNQFVVTTTTDAPDAVPGDGTCEATAGLGDCTLRAAVMEANAEPGPNDIELGDGNTFPLTIPTSTDDPSDGDLDITDTVSINGRSTIAPTTDRDR